VERAGRVTCAQRLVQHEIDEHLSLMHYVLDWKIPKIIVNGKLADDYHRLEFKATPEVAADFSIWYREITPDNLRLMLAEVSKNKEHSIELTNQLTTGELLERIHHREEQSVKLDTNAVNQAAWQEITRWLHATVGPQQAHDLVDRAASEVDDRRAIALSLRALRYGKASIQAKKAYQELAGRYKNLGNKPRAIMYYTKALAIGEPDAYTLFQRGQLFYTLREYADARTDLNRVLALTDEEQFFPREYELARKYLTHIAR